MAPVILVIGASGESGLAVIRAAAASTEKPATHAFCRTTSKIPAADAALCASLIDGDATKAEDVERALEQSKADIVVMTIGAGNDLGPCTVRRDSTKALMDVAGPGSKYEHVKIVVLSSMGAGGTKIDIGFGIGMLVTMRLKNVLKDHDAQEEELWRRLGDGQRGRAWVLHPPQLGVGRPEGEAIVFEGRIPNGKIDRAVLARFIIKEICDGCKSFGKAVCVTAKK